MKTLYLSGIVGYDFNQESVTDFLRDANGAPIIIMIESPGGSVIDGFEIVNSLNDYKGEKTIVWGTMVASAAFYIAVGVTTNVVKAYSRNNTTAMYHNAWGLAIGDYRELNLTAHIYEQMTDIMAAAIAAKLKKDKKTVREEMDVSTWLFANEIVETGLVDMAINESDNELQIELPVKQVKNYAWLNGLSIDGKKEFIKKELKNLQNLNKDHGNFDNIAALLGENKEIIAPIEVPIEVPIEASINQNKGGKTLNYAEFITQNPAALAEILQSKEIAEHTAKAIKANNENVLQILALSGSTLSDDVKDSITRCINPADHALNVLTRQQALRAGSGANGLTGLTGQDSAAFNGANGKEKEQAAKTDEGKGFVAKALDKALPKKAGA